jgi:hypothetical protein
MRVLFCGFFVCALMVGCTSPSRPQKKPSPCHYPQPAPAQARR